MHELLVELQFVLGAGGVGQGEGDRGPDEHGQEPGQP